MQSFDTSPTTSPTTSPVTSVVINLARRADRYMLFRHRCPHSNVERFNAVDKRHIKTTKFNEKVCEKQFTVHQDTILAKNLNGGEMGVYLSHVCIWEAFVNDENSQDYLLVYEDDALFCPQYHDKLSRVLEDLHTIDNFDTILFIGGRFVPNFVTQNVIPVTEHIVKTDYSKWNPVQHDRTAHAYIISKQCCQLFLDSISTNSNHYWEKGPVDHYMVGLLRHLGKDTYHCSPLLCHSPMVGDSDIR